MKTANKPDLKNKNIIVGVCGGIAAYKACELVRLLVKGGANVECILTPNGAKFVTPLTLQTLSQHKVYCDMFETNGDVDIEHISLSEKAVVIIVSPATAGTIAKLAAGMADNLLVSTILASRAKILICPSMNDNMLSHPATKKNIAVLKEYGYFFTDSPRGQLACGKTGNGRLADPKDIFEKVKRLLKKN